MAECIFAWICIIIAFCTGDAMWAIASALFALDIRMMVLVDIKKRGADNG